MCFILKKKIGFLLVLTFLINLNFSAQTEAKIEADSLFFQVLEQWRSYPNPSLAGYRIQVSFYGQHAEAKQNLDFFKEKFPSEFAELDYKQPYHRLRVGTYRNKADAVKDLKEYIKKGYNGAFIVKVRIPLKDLYATEDL